MALSGDVRRHAPATLRNRGPIIEVLRRALPGEGQVLEIASGTGEHAVAFAEAFPHLAMLPSDPDPVALASIAAHRAAAGTHNLHEPVRLDAAAATWPVGAVAAVICINMLHVAPWEAAEGLMAGAARCLVPDGLLYLYGPFREGGRHTGPGNAAFDAELRRSDPACGVRDLEAVAALAGASGLVHTATIVMPANNRSLLFRRIAACAERGGE